MPNQLTITDLPDIKPGLMPPKTARNVKIARDYLSGTTVQDIAKQYNLSTRQVYRVLATDDAAREIITWGVQQNVLMLPSAVQGHKELIEQVDDKTVRLNAIKLAYGNTSITPSHTVNNYIGNLTVNNNQVNISPDMIRALSQGIGAKIEDDAEVIDADVSEIKDD